MSQLQSPRPEVIRTSDEYINALSDYHGDTTTKSDSGSLRFQWLLSAADIVHGTDCFIDRPHLLESGGGHLRLTKRAPSLAKTVVTP